MQLLHFHKGWIIQFLQALAFEGLVEKSPYINNRLSIFPKIGA
jgi:hypothetical protein